ncbi:MAG: Do family serine endopeptidase [Pelagibacterales bacterium]|nr:Do family serine endopeptidase [Pelagibacterales bacterium]
MITINYYSKHILKICFFSLLFSVFSLSHAEETLPNFTKIVEKNIPAVVIVNATRTITQNNKRPQLNMPDVPEEFREYFDKFFNGNNGQGNRQREAPSFGSGFILSADGFIMTNLHVVNNADQITITFSDYTELDAKLIGKDKRSDLALLKVDANNLPVVTIGTSENLKIGEWVLAIGSPFGFDHTVTAGIISGKKRTLPNESYVPYIQTDVAINPGNSGGPLFNLNGEVIGVNAQIFTRSGGFMGVSFAIPSETLSDVYAQLKNGGKVKRGWLGVYIQEVDKDLAKSFGLKKPTGAVVAKIIEEGPAKKSGLKQGDIILKFDNKVVNKSKDLPLMVGAAKVNKIVDVEILRNKRILIKRILIEELPEEEKIAGMNQNKIDKIEATGISVEDIDEKIKKKLNIYGGAKVIDISDDSTNNSKIKVDDIVTHINNEPVYNANDFVRKIEKMNNNSLANFLVYRNSTPIYLAIKISN